MVCCLVGAGLLWFGWFGFNGGSALASNGQAGAALAASQIAAAGAALSWMTVEWIHRGKPTALGLASGLVAGLVAVTPASGFVTPFSGLIIGLLAGGICYLAVCLKPSFKYDDSLDAFGVHGVGGFLGAFLTGVFASSALVKAGTGEAISSGGGWLYDGNFSKLGIQLIAAVAAIVYSFAVSFVLVKAIDLTWGFCLDSRSENEGLDRSEHGEIGFDLGPSLDLVPEAPMLEPRAAMVPPNGEKRFTLIVEGVKNGDLIHFWSDLCQTGSRPPSPEFTAVYPFMTTVRGNRFQFRGGDPAIIKDNLQRLFRSHFGGGAPIKVNVES